MAARCEEEGGRTALTFVDLFAGSGAGHLAMSEAGFSCVLANDISEVKQAAYAANFSGTPLDPRSIRDLRGHLLRGVAAFTVSSPCTDHTSEGRRLGFAHGERGILAFEAIRLVHEARPRVVVFENVTGLLTARGGADLALLAQALVSAKYVVGAAVIDSLPFVAQSRERLFVVAVRSDVDIPPALHAAKPDPYWHPAELRAARAALSPEARRAWRWWRLPRPGARELGLADLLEPGPHRWLPEARTDRLAALLTPADRGRIAAARAAGVAVGVVAGKRRLVDGALRRVQEVRLDGHARCLLTDEGGNDMQRLLVLDDSPRGFRLRDFTRRERARLTGLPDGYVLPRSEKAVRLLTGDAVVVPAYAHLARHLLRPLAEAPARAAAPAARPTPRRRRKEAGADGRIVSPRNGIKGATTTVTATSSRPRPSA